VPIIFTYRSFDKNNNTPSDRRDKKASLLLAVLLTLVITIITTTPSIAVHKGAGDLVCGGCHTMHSSQGGASSPSMGTASGAAILLRGPVTSRADIQKLCLQCHSQTGSQATNVFQPHGQLAPKVLGANWDMSKSFGEIGAGGDFVNEVDGSSFDSTAAGNNNALGYGHSVGKNGASPPGNPNNPTVNLTCTTCHDPHGTTQNTWDGDTSYGVNVYRNLNITFGRDTGCNMQLCHNGVPPNAPGELWHMKSWVGGITGKAGDIGANYTPSYTATGNVAIWPVYRKEGSPTTTTDNNVYDGISDNSADATPDGYSIDGGMGDWCARCHPKMHEDSSSENGPVITALGNDWKRHPANRIIDSSYKSGAGVNTIDWTHYSGISAGYKVPAANTGTTLSSEYYYADTDNEDKVFCLSCHFAHAGPYYDALRWDYIAAVDAAGGSQTGNGVPSNRGCQQCHNR